MSNVVPLRGNSTRRQSHGLIHVLANEDGLEVHHESASGGSFALLARFGLNERETALRAALDALPTYAPCRLGEVPKWA